jgi:hypothetical protein
VRKIPLRRRFALAAMAVFVLIASGIGAFAVHPWDTGPTCSAKRAHPEWSVARRWDEALLDAIRRALLWPNGVAGPWMTVSANQLVVIERGATQARPWSPPQT